MIDYDGSGTLYDLEDDENTTYINDTWRPTTSGISYSRIHKFINN